MCKSVKKNNTLQEVQRCGWGQKQYSLNISYILYVEYDNKEIYLLILIDTYLHANEIDIFTFISPGNLITLLYTNIIISNFL